MRWIPMMLAFLLALTGCGTDGDPEIASAGGTQNSEPEAQDTSDEEQALEFVECMRDNGIDLPDPEPDGNGGFKWGLGEAGVDLGDQAVRDAIQACRELLPEGSQGDRSSPESIEQLREFAECMRDNGIDMPDPSPEGDFGGFLGETDMNSPEFQKALDACRDTLPRGGR